MLFSVCCVRWTETAKIPDCGALRWIIFFPPSYNSLVNTVSFFQIAYTARSKPGIIKQQFTLPLLDSNQ